MDMWKRWMLIFWHEVECESVRDDFYFDTEDEMKKFVKENDIRVEKMFHLVDVDW